MDAYNRRLLRDHRMATGPDAPREVVRAAMLRLANGFAKGTSGVRPELLARVVDALNAGEIPRVRMLGSAGQSDLGPLADLAYGICGDMPLAAKEGISLINNNSFGTGLAALALADAQRLLDAFTVGCRARLGGLRGQHLPPPPGRRRRAALSRHRAAQRAHARAARRLVPVGARRRAQPPGSAHVPQRRRHPRAPSTTVSRSPARSSRSSSTRRTRTRSSPSHEAVIISVANYEALPLAAALDFARIALVPAISSAMERSIKLLQAPLTGLGTGLQESEAESNECALSEFAWVSQSLMVEARSLAHPLSTETASTSLAEGIEDRITMAPLSARRLSEQVAVAEELLAVGPDRGRPGGRRARLCAARARHGARPRAGAGALRLRGGGRLDRARIARTSSSSCARARSLPRV